MNTTETIEKLKALAEECTAYRLLDDAKTIRSAITLLQNTEKDAAFRFVKDGDEAPEIGDVVMTCHLVISDEREREDWKDWVLMRPVNDAALKWSQENKTGSAIAAQQEASK